MLAIQKARATWRRAPRISAVGVVVMIVAGVADVTVHLMADGHHHPDGVLAHGAHLLGIAGMVLVLVGLVAFGARRSVGRRFGPHLEGPHDAHR